MRKRIAGRSGETLVETLAAMAVFLLMMGILQGAHSFCTNAQQRSEALRKINAGICREVRTTAPDPLPAGRTAVYCFRAVSADGGKESDTLFQVKVGLGSKTVTYRDEAGNERTAVFSLFQSASSDPAGGEDP